MSRARNNAITPLADPGQALIDPLTIFRDRPAIEAAIETLIVAMDRCEPDPDFEPEEEGACAFENVIVPQGPKGTAIGDADDAEPPGYDRRDEVKAAGRRTRIAGARQVQAGISVSKRGMEVVKG